jgi:hypothetical protein
MPRGQEGDMIRRLKGHISSKWDIARHNDAYKHALDRWHAYKRDIQP